MSITPVAPQEIAHLGIALHRAARGAQVRSTTRDGAVVVDLIPQGVDRARRVARYELRVANDTPGPLAAYAYAVPRTAGAKPVMCLALAVRAHSALQLGFEVALLRRTTYERVTVELRGDDLLLTVDALPPPPIPEFPRSIFAIAAAVVVAALVGTFLTMRPRIVGLSVPNVALSGSRVDAVYAARGSGSLRYELDTNDGHVLASAPLPAHDGTIPIVAGPPRTYLLRLSMQGPLGGDARVATLESQPRPVARTVTRVEHLARIASLAVDRERVSGGSPITVYYDIDAKSGTVRLVDRNGVAWGERSLHSGAGQVALQAPVFAEPRNLTVEVRAGEGRAAAESSVGVLVAPEASPTPKASAPPSRAPSPPPSRPPSAPGRVGSSAMPFALPKGPIGAGILNVPVLRNEEGLRISLVAPDGREVQNEAVGDKRSIALAIPKVDRSARYTVVATFNRGNAEETVVRGLTVAP